MLGFGAECLEEVNRSTADRTYVEHCLRRIRRKPEPFKLVGNGTRTLLLELVHDTQNWLKADSHPGRGELGPQELAVVHPEFVAVDVESTHELRHDCEHLAVGGG